jgi:hypothetical protein
MRIRVVIRYPDRKKNSVTPKFPGMKLGTLAVINAWERNTGRIATHRKPSSEGM